MAWKDSDSDSDDAKAKAKAKGKNKKVGCTPCVGVCNLKIFQAASSVCTSSANCLFKVLAERLQYIYSTSRPIGFYIVFPVDDPRNLSR